MVVGNFINLGNRKKQQTLSNTMFFKLALILRTRVWIPSTLKFCEASIVHLTDVSSLIINYVILLTLMMFLTSLYHIMCSDMRLPLYMYIGNIFTQGKIATKRLLVTDIWWKTCNWLWSKLINKVIITQPVMGNIRKGIYLRIINMLLAK
jgi:hypothetical protein